MPSPGEDIHSSLAGWDDIILSLFLRSPVSSTPGKTHNPNPKDESQWKNPEGHEWVTAQKPEVLSTSQTNCKKRQGGDKHHRSVNLNPPHHKAVWLNALKC